jgi:hypothetical protein
LDNRIHTTQTAHNETVDAVTAHIGSEMGLKQSEVAYKIQYHDTTTSKTILRLMTDGILVAEMIADPHLSKYGINNIYWTDIFYLILEMLRIDERGRYWIDEVINQLAPITIKLSPGIQFHCSPVPGEGGEMADDPSETESAQEMAERLLDDEYWKWWWKLW